MGQDLPIYLIPLLPLLGAAINLIFGRWLSRRTVHFVAVGAVAAAFAVVALKLAGPLWDQFAIWGSSDGRAAIPSLHEPVYTWIEAGKLKINLAFTFDTLSAVMCMLITFVGALIHIYSTGYMHEERRYAAYFGYLNLFTGAMLILVLGDSLPVMFIGWEGVGLCSYLLIGFWFEKEANAHAGRKAFVVNRIGDFAFLLGMFLIFWAIGSMNIREINELVGAPRFAKELVAGQPVITIGCLLLFIGACGKSAQIPLYVWLPDAMAGPTPVSALIHAATMVTAGVYMIARLSFLFAASPVAMAVVAGVGALTALVAAIIAFAQTDFKKVLAYSTVSQLGFMFVGVGTGAFGAGVFHLLTHGFFKAGLFLSAGSVMHAMSGSGDITKMGGLRKKLPITHACFIIYWLAICGIPPFSGFFSKDEILLGAFVKDVPGVWPAMYGKLLWFVLTIAAAGTAFYMSRLYFMVFTGKCRADEHTKAHIHESPSSMTWPLVILAASTCVLGVLGLPHLKAVHLPHLLPTWLESAIKADEMGHASDGTTIALMILATALGAAAILLARVLYSDGPSPGVQRWTATRLGARVRLTLYNKLYVDELYDSIIIRPFRWFCRQMFQVVDRVIIDFLLVGGTAVIVDLFGRVTRWWQNGMVQRYLVAVVVGAALIVVFATRSSADFSYRTAGARSVQFKADVGSGSAAKGATVRWDFDGDGRHDSTDAAPSWTFDADGTYRVTLWVKDGVFGRSGKVTKQIKVGGSR